MIQDEDAVLQGPEAEEEGAGESANHVAPAQAEGSAEASGAGDPTGSRHALECPPTCLEGTQDASSVNSNK